MHFLINFSIIEQGGLEMKVKVNQDACIGCGACQAIAPDVFEVNDGLAQAIVDIVPKEAEEDAMDALEGCPTDAIVKVDPKETEN